MVVVEWRSVWLFVVLRLFEVRSRESVVCDFFWELGRFLFGDGYFFSGIGMRLIGVLAFLFGKGI